MPVRAPGPGQPPLEHRGVALGDPAGGAEGDRAHRQEVTLHPPLQGVAGGAQEVGEVDLLVDHQQLRPVVEAPQDRGGAGRSQPEHHAGGLRDRPGEAVGGRQRVLDQDVHHRRVGMAHHLFHPVADGLQARHEMEHPLLGGGRVVHPVAGGLQRLPRGVGRLGGARRGPEGCEGQGPGDGAGQGPEPREGHRAKRVVGHRAGAVAQPCRRLRVGGDFGPRSQ